MSRFLLALRDNPAVFADMSPGQMQELIQAYGAWSAKLGKRQLSGEKLKDGEGRVVQREGASKDGPLKVTDGPYAETHEIFGGLYILEADSYDDVLAEVETCPHLKYGTIEIREIEELPEM